MRTIRRMATRFESAMSGFYTGTLEYRRNPHEARFNFWSGFWFWVAVAFGWFLAEWLVPR